MSISFDLGKDLDNLVQKYYMIGVEEGKQYTMIFYSPLEGLWRPIYRANQHFFDGKFTDLMAYYPEKSYVLEGRKLYVEKRPSELIGSAGWVIPFEKYLRKGKINHISEFLILYRENRRKKIARTKKIEEILRSERYFWIDWQNRYTELKVKLKREEMGDKG